MDVVRKYSYQLDLDPSFRILDDTEAELLRNDIIQEVLKSGMEKKEKSKKHSFALSTVFQMTEMMQKLKHSF